MAWRIATLWLLLLLAVPAAADELISLGVGTQKVLTVRGGIKRISVGDPTVADVKPIAPDQVLVIAGKEGRTTLLVWRNDGRRQDHLVVVRTVAVDETVAEIRQLLEGREGIEVRTVGDRIFLDGEALTVDDTERIAQILELYPGVRSLVRLSPEARAVVARNLEASLHAAGMERVRATSVGATIFLEGTVESAHELERSRRLTKALGESVENLLTVGLQRMVHSEVHFVEVRRSQLTQFGVKPPVELAGTASFTANVVSGGAFGWEAGASGAGQWSVRAALTRGNGRLLARPTLVCASGEEAEFLAGGEVPIPLVTANTVNVDYKPYGIVMRIRPTVDRQGNIETVIEAEVSELDRSVAVAVGTENAVPGFRNRKVKTKVAVQAGQTIVLSGVFSHDEQKTVSKVPVLGQVPLLGELFKQRSIDDSERELLIFVTPRLVEPDGVEVQRAVEGARRRYGEARDDVELGILD